jgi:hypothetical protein
MESHDALQVSQPANFVPAIMKLRHRHLLRASLQLVLHIRLRTKAIDVRRDCRIEGGARKDDGEGEPKSHGDMSAHNIRFDEQDHQEEERKRESEGDDCFWYSHVRNNSALRSRHREGSWVCTYKAGL